MPNTITTVYGIWNLTEGRWARTPEDRQFQTNWPDIALDSLAMSHIKGEVRVIPDAEIETFAVGETPAGEKGAVWKRGGRP